MPITPILLLWVELVAEEMRPQIILAPLFKLLLEQQTLAVEVVLDAGTIRQTERQADLELLFCVTLERNAALVEQ
jgi:hypothetical protein